MWDRDKDTSLGVINLSPCLDGVELENEYENNAPYLYHKP